MGKFRGLSLVIVLAVAGAPAGGKQPRLDRYGDPLPDGAVARLGSQRWRHPGGVSALAFCPDGRFLLSAGHDGKQGADVLRLWEVPTGRLVRRYTGLKGPISSVRFSPDGRLLAAGRQSGTCCVWDTTTGKERHRFHPRDTFHCEVIFAPDSKRLAWSGTGLVVLWDLSVGKELRRFRKSDALTLSVAFSPDGRLLAAADAEAIYLWEAATGKQVARLVTGERPVHVWCLAFSPDGRTLAAGEPVGTVRLWDVVTRREVGQLLAPERVCDLAFSPDGRSLAGAVRDETMALLWEMATGKVRWRLRKPGGGASYLALAPDGKTLAVADRYSAVISLVNLATGKEITPSEGHEFAVNAVAFSPDSRTLAAGSSSSLLLWDPRSGKELRRITDPPPYVGSLAFSPDGRIFTASGATKECRRWRLDSDEKIQWWSAKGEYGGLSFAADGKLLAHAGDEAVTVWDAATGNERLSLPAPQRMAFRAAAFSPDGRTLATAASPATKPPGTPTSGLRLWDAHSGKELRRLGGKDTVALAVAFSADGRTLVSLSADGVRLWEVYTGGERGCINARQAGYPGKMAFSSDGRVLALAGADGTIRLWSATKLRELRRLRGHEGEVMSLAFSPDGRLLASGSMDATVLIWDVAAGRHD